MRIVTGRIQDCCNVLVKRRFARGAKAHLSDDETVAKMGHPAAPFAGWRYEPEYLPAPLAMHIDDAGVEEPMWVYLGFLSRRLREQWFVPHGNGAREITGLTLVTPVVPGSEASRRAVEDGVLTVVSGAEHLMQIELDGGIRGESVDLRPELPLVFVR
jgi:hypothetical protein